MSQAVRAPPPLSIPVDQTADCALGGLSLLGIDKQRDLSFSKEYSYQSPPASNLPLLQKHFFLSNNYGIPSDLHWQQGGFNAKPKDPSLGLISRALEVEARGVEIGGPRR